MKTIVFLIPSFQAGGAERVMVNLILSIDRSKYTVVIISLKDVGPLKEEISGNIPIHFLKAKRARYVIPDLIKILNQIKPQVVMSTLGPLNLFLLMVKPFLKNKPKIICREANTPSKDIERYSNYVQKIYPYFYRKLYPKADFIVAQCKEMQADIEMFAHYPKGKTNIQTIYNPVDIENVKKKSKDLVSTFDADNFNVVSVGRLTKQKGYDLLISAFLKVVESNENARLYIFGEGEDEPKLRQIINELNLQKYVKLMGFKKNPYKFVSKADCYVLSSRWEGFPNVILESLVCETEVIAFQCKSGPEEILLENPTIGHLIEPENVELLAEKILEVSRAETKIASVDFEEVYNKYSIENIMKQYESLFER